MGQACEHVWGQVEAIRQAIEAVERQLQGVEGER